MIRSTAIRRIARTICAAILAVAFSVSAYADDTAASDYYETVYDPAMFFWNLAVQSQDYGGYIDGVPFPGAYGTAPTSSGSYSVPLDLDSRFNRLYYGANYNAVAGDYDYGATFKVVVTLTTVDSSEYSKVYPPNLYRTLPNGRYINRIDRESLSYDYTYTLSGGAHTFTFDNIPYDEIAGASFFYLDFNLSAFNSVTSNELYFINSYFGLSSYFDENKYAAQTLENLTEISGKLDNIEDAINDAGDGIQSGLADVGNKVDDAADQISGDLDELQEEIATQHIKEEEYAEDQGNSNITASQDAIDSSGLFPNPASIWDGVGKLIECCSSEVKYQHFEIPEVKLPSLSVSGSALPEVVLIKAQKVYFTEIINNEHMQTLISVIEVFYYIFFAIFIIDYCRKLIDKITLRGSDLSDAYNKEVTKRGG